MNKIWCLGLSLALGLGSAQAARQMEWLNRGLVAVKTTNGVFLSWRVLGTDGNTTGFNLYRDGEKIASFTGSQASNYTDTKGTASSKYSVKAVVGGKEMAADAAVSVWSNQYLTVNLDRPNGGSDYTYSPNDIAVGDVDGDGEFELILKWDPSNSKDNSQKGKTGNVIIDCYKINGKKLWRIDLGVNIRAGAHYTQMLVGDYDSDGKAEFAVKTAPGTKDGSGKYLSLGSAKGADHSKDYRNSNGYILTGPEWLTIFNGETGKEMATVDYNPGRGTVKSWGDSYGNRVDRFLATNAYLDGKKPSMVFQRGYYTRMAITAYDWDGKTLSQRWYYNAATSGQECYGQGNHNISAGDVDGDGFDEIIEGSCAVDHDGKFMYRTGKGHGDAMHLSDLDPDNPGLEVWQVHEEKPYGYDLHDARTGKLLFSETSDGDNGRGVAGDVDSTNRGHELWSAANWNTYTVKGKVLSSSRPAYNFRIYWDGDLLDELLDNTTISKWDNAKQQSNTLFQMQGQSCNSTKATPNFSGDILGDWREEVILHDGASKLYIYTTTIPTEHRMYTLAHDPIYRLGMSWQNTAYNQPPHLGFWLYGNKDKFPAPDITLVGDQTPKAAAIIKQGAGSSSQAIALGDSIIPFTFAIQNADGATVENLPAGVTAKWNAQTNSLYFSGTPTVSGEYTYTITTKGGDAEFGEATRSGKFTITDTNAPIIPADSTNGIADSTTTSLKSRVQRMLMNGSGRIYDLRGRLVKQRKHRGVYLTR
ncbi:rhamnogalacturonan lyase [Fibrobacter sp.]|uniref:rhamnogalacturonan lyase n=1 Tax=Fibrobacter sp. TaxID=35828 RepID=UPI00386F314F